MAYQRKDAFYARAKQAGYRSRAAYKLAELARRYKLIDRGDHVVDLGAWPGGWLQVAAELVGPRGVVVGVDLKAIDQLGGVVATIVGDARDAAVREQIRSRCNGRVDVVLSDMAPSLSGVRDRDIAQAVELATTAVGTAVHMLAPGGNLVLKLFTAPEADALVAEVRRRFGSAKLTRPEATRKGSDEIYLVCSGFKG
jgi:23S rRNA (uridine2552-2'-O)-methyltransferase